MGWFDSVCDFVGSCVSGAKTVLSDVASGVKTVVSDIYDGVTGLFSSGRSTAKEMGDSDAYDRELATARQTAMINASLADFKNKASDQAYKLEEKLTDICEEAFEELLNHIEKLNDKDFCGSTLNIPTRKIRSDNRRILRGIRGALNKEIMPKISIDDAECLEILKKPKGKDKEKAMLDFINQTLIASINKLKRDLGRDVKDGIEYTKEQIEAGFDNLEGIFKSNLNSLKLLKESAGDIEANERDQMNVAFDLWKSQYIYQVSQVSKKKGK